MFVGRTMGKSRRWFLGGRVSLLWPLMYILMGGFVLYSLIVGHTP